jgi:hypothetical protein
MFASTEKNRKRPRNDAENANATTVATTSSSTAGIASKDVNAEPVPVVCLTGFSPNEKDHYHKLIEALGGR